jgi:hypothetical protein
MKSSTQLLPAFLLCACITTTASAGQITLADSVSILGTEYTVSLLYSDLTDLHGSFLGQSFNSLNPTITFTTQADATAAAVSLRDTFGADFDWHPISSLNGVRIVYSFDSSDYNYMTVSDCCGGSNVYGPHTISRDHGNFFSIAQFTAREAVPEPESYALMMLGLASLRLAARRRQA